MQAKIGRPLRKATWVAAVAILWQYPEAAAGLFLLWLFWDSLDGMARRAYDDHRASRTARALREDLHARVDPYSVHLMNEREKALRRRRARARERRAYWAGKARALTARLAGPWGPRLADGCRYAAGEAKNE